MPLDRSPEVVAGDALICSLPVCTKDSDRLNGDRVWANDIKCGDRERTRYQLMKTIEAPYQITSTEERWVKSKSACEHLGISVPTLRRWVKAKKLTPKRTPTGEFRFRKSELDALLA